MAEWTPLMGRVNDREHLENTELPKRALEGHWTGKPSHLRFTGFWCEPFVHPVFSRAQWM